MSYQESTRKLTTTNEDGATKEEHALCSSSPALQERHHPKHPESLQIRTKVSKPVFAADGDTKGVENEHSRPATLGKRQDAKHSGTSQVSIEVFNSLLATVETLKESMESMEMSNKELREEITDVRGKLHTLHESLGVACPKAFPRFPELPAEIQTMIWKAALESARILALRRSAFHLEEPQPWGIRRPTKTFIPIAHGTLLVPLVKEHSAIRRVCRAARQEALDYQRGIYNPSKYHLSHPDNFVRQFTQTVQNPDIFVRPHIDTVWYVGCPKTSTGYDPAHPDVYLRFILRSLLPGRISKLAISWSQWMTELRCDIVGFMHSLEVLGVTEVTIVVGHLTAAYARDPILVEPGERSQPYWGACYSEWRTFIEIIDKLSNRRRRSNILQPTHEEYAWSILSTEMMSFLSLVQVKKARRMALQIQHDGQTLESLNLDDKTRDCSGWTVTSIRFVEATTLSSVQTEQGN